MSKLVIMFNKNVFVFLDSSKSHETVDLFNISRSCRPRCTADHLSSAELRTCLIHDTKKVNLLHHAATKLNLSRKNNTNPPQILSPDLRKRLGSSKSVYSGYWVFPDWCE